LIDIFPGNFGGSNWRDIGLEAIYTDKGVGALQPNSDGMFKVPNLKNVALTAPYMHDGRFATLDAVLNHYSENIQPSANLDWSLRDNDGGAVKLNLTTTEKSDLIAFLKTMTDHQLVTDPKFSNPFK
jgi:cytochrome c peroxidase